MALEIKFTVTVDRDNKRFLLTETTGNYSVTNDTGWGNPNETRAVIESAIFYATFPDGTVESTNILTFIQAGTINRIVTSFKPDSFIDGKYKFEIKAQYTRSIPGPDNLTEIVKFTSLFGILDLQDIYKLPYTFIVDKIDFCKPMDCDCTVNILTIWAYLKALESSYQTENSVQTEELYNRISKLIDG